MPYLRNKRTGETIFVPDGPQQAVPANPLKVQGAQADIAGTQASTARTVGQESRDAALFGAEKALREAQAAKARAEAQQASGLDKQKLANILAAQGQIDRLHHLFNKGPGRTSGVRGLLDYLPSQGNKQFDTAGAGLGEVGLAAFRVPGVGAQSDAELRAFIAANRPSASDYDAVIREKLGNLQNRLNQTYSAYGLKRQTAKKFKDEPRTIDFNSLPD